MEQFLASLDPWLVYVLVGLLTFGESAAFLGLLLPGEVALVGAAAIAGVVGLSPVALVVVAALCATAGGLFGYELGRRFGPRLLALGPVRKRIGPRVSRMAGRLDGPAGLSLVVIGRFNQATRAAVPAMAGMGSMRWGVFATANLAGALAWAVLFTTVGYYGAEWWRASSWPVQVVSAAVLAGAAGVWVATGRDDEPEVDVSGNGLPSARE